MDQPVTIDRAFQVALKHHQAGELPQAERIYRQILAHQPNHAEALHLLGSIAAHVGRNDAAIDLFRRAIAINPNFPVAYYNLGAALQAKEKTDDAIAAYSKAISLHPNFPQAHNNLGNALKQKGCLDEAIEAYRRAIALDPNFAEAHGNLGNALNDKGQVDDAIAEFRRAISLKPDHAIAHSNLGNTLLQKSGHIDEAIAACRAAIALRPNFPEAHYNLGNSLHAKRDFSGAIAAFRQAISLRPDYFHAYGSLGLALKEKGELDGAISSYRQAISLNPGFAEAYCNLGSALYAARQVNEAVAAYQQAIALRPGYAEAFYNLGIAYGLQGQIEKAIVACRNAIALKPESPEAYNNLGNVLKVAKQLDAATAAYQQAIVLRPAYADVYSNLGLVLEQQGRLDEAVAAHRQAIQLNPKLHEAHSNLGNALKTKGQLDEAIAAFRQALALKPGSATAHCNLVYTLQFYSGSDAQSIAEENRLWNQVHTEPLKIFREPHSNDRDPQRRLRIGYVSPDFYNHCQAHFMTPLLSAHDRGSVEIFCYSDVARPDAVTTDLKSRADVWRNILGMSDEQLDRVIRRDQIDILVDLTMHMAYNRLTLFARKPAPVQVSWLAYPGSTGLTAIDYRLSDPYLDPPGVDESIYSEETIRLPDSFWCYDPLDGRDVGVNSLPALHTGVVTFGCLNNFCKINDGILTLWARVMSSLPDSRLLLLAGQGDHRQRTIDFLTHQGINPRRVEFVDPRPRPQYMELYNRIDLGLDSYPYNGHTTSLDSFWMGVPVITLAGQTAVSRAGWCQLSNLGLLELAAQTPVQFVQIATELAGDLPRLNRLRSTLRRRMEQSPLMDAPRFARNIEVAYRQMWRTFCTDAASR